MSRKSDKMTLREIDESLAVHGYTPWSGHYAQPERSTGLYIWENPDPSGGYGLVVLDGDTMNAAQCHWSPDRGQVTRGQYFSGGLSRTSIEYVAEFRPIASVLATKDFHAQKARDDAQLERSMQAWHRESRAKLRAQGQKIPGYLWEFATCDEMAEEGYEYE